MEQARISWTAIEDPPEVRENNPIHGAGAQAVGYDRPIVAGVSSYGWAIAPAVELLGERWFAHGWSEYALRRPVFAGDQVEAVATLTEPGLCEFVLLDPEGKAAVEGRAGLGLGPWHGEWQLPTRREPVPPVDPPPLVLPEEVQADVDLPPMAFSLTPAAAAEWAAARLGDAHRRYEAGPDQFVHPSWLPALYVGLVRHSCRQPDVGIHVSGRVQNLVRLRPGTDLVAAGRWTMHSQRKQRWWAGADSMLLDAAGQELAYFSQIAILLPPFDSA